MAKAQTPPAPTWWLRVQEARPECFTHDQWDFYLGGVLHEARGQPWIGSALEAGGMPDYCGDCTWSAAMSKQGRCHPPIKPGVSSAKKS